VHTVGSQGLALSNLLKHLVPGADVRVQVEDAHAIRPGLA
jgi:hypothetical protein